MNTPDSTVYDPPAATPPPPAPTADLMSEPTDEECLLAWNQYHEDHKAGRLSFAGIPEGHHVAYFGGRIIDHDADYVTLQARAAEAAGVHWARLIISYPWAW